jgi:CDP-glucose 4,6-dehydratase
VHFLVTGHTGFKGSWLIAMLHALGHEVSGIALEPDRNSLFNRASLGKFLKHDFRIDIRNRADLVDAVRIINPDVLIHMAAQSQVLESYISPIETYEVNVTGTLNTLAAAVELTNLKATLIVTTDKVYKNVGTLKSYTEEDQLGGDDPYSASKAMADILTQSWSKSSGKGPIGIARAGNVIGGGDHSRNRIIPNLMESLLRGENPILRNPKSIRPWQNVLDCLNGYLKLVDELIQNKESSVFNFGPDLDICRSVEELTNLVISITNPSKHWELSDLTYAREEDFLLIDSSKARRLLNWKEKYSFESSVIRTVNWYKESDSNNNEMITFNEVEYFLAVQ